MQQTKSIFASVLLLLVMSVSAFAEAQQNQFWENFLDAHKNKIDFVSFTAFRDVKKATRSVFSNAVNRVPYFVEQIYPYRHDMDLWIQRFNELVLDQKSLDVMFDAVRLAFKKDLDTNCRQLIEDLKRDYVEQIRIKLDVSNTEVDLAQIKAALPTAEEIATKVYVELEKLQLNQPNLAEQYTQVLQNMSDTEKLTTIGSFLLLSIIFKSPNAIMIPVSLYQALSFYEKLEIGRYSTATTREIMNQRDAYYRILEQGYKALIRDILLRSKKMLDNSVKENAKIRTILP